MSSVFFVFVAHSGNAGAAPCDVPRTSENQCLISLDRGLGAELGKALRKIEENKEEIREFYNHAPESIRKKYELTEKNGELFLALRDAPLVKVDQDIVAKYDVKTSEKPVAIRFDPRSSLLVDPRNLDRATAKASDLAYDIHEKQIDGSNSVGEIPSQEIKEKLPDYRLVKIYVDPLTGFQGLALEYKDKKDRMRHRIYASAGTQTFENTDFRDWATGLTMARAQFSSDAALLMAEDAAGYASDAVNGGEVVFTGQSLGGLLAQGIGFNTQALLDKRKLPHQFLQQVTWGGTGALEPIEEMIQLALNGQQRGFNPQIEKHLLNTSAQAKSSKPIWDELKEFWAQNRTDSKDNPADFIKDTFSRMRVVGYVFGLDYFSHVGTFLGKTYSFPLSSIIPTVCENFRLVNLAGFDIGSLGFILESHFLSGYERALERGALESTATIQTKKWNWVSTLQKNVEPAGIVWLEDLYLTRLSRDKNNWKRCLKSGAWSTSQNSNCKSPDWPGCSPSQRLASSSKGSKGAVLSADYCLIK